MQSQLLLKQQRPASRDRVYTVGLLKAANGDGLGELQRNITLLRDYVERLPVHHVNQFLDGTTTVLPDPSEDKSFKLNETAKYTNFLDKLLQKAIAGKMLGQEHVNLMHKKEGCKMSAYCSESSPWLHAQLDVLLGRQITYQATCHMSEHTQQKHIFLLHLSSGMT